MDSSKKDDRASFMSESSIQDDDSERKKRRSMALVSKNTSAMDVQMTADPEEIINHIDICLKMFFENKINSKNAWNIKIIDYMAKYLQLRKDSRDTLQLAGTSLDVGAKVYSIRVDDVHSTGLKLASDMSKIAHKNREEHDNENAEENEDLNPPKKTGATKKKKKFVLGGPKHTIAKDVNTLLQDVQKLDSAIFKTKSDSNLSMVDNFLTNRISNDKSGCTFTLMSKETLWVSAEDTDHTLVDKRYPFKLPAENKFNLCPEFESFKVDEWDPDNEKGSGADSIHDTEVIFDDKGIPIHELDGPIDDVFNDSDHTDSDGEAAGPAEINILGEVANVVDLRPTTSTEADDYCFRPISSSDKGIINIWRGPSHWKYKYLKRAESRFSGNVVKEVAQKRKVKEKEMPKIDFLNGTPVCLENSISNVKTTLKPWPETNRYRIPINPTKISNIMNMLFLKPEVMVERRGAEEHSAQSNSDEIVPYEYGNPNDSIYCTQNNDNVDDNTDDIVPAEELPTAGQNQAYTRENLIDLPEMVETNFINYATKSKKMDMKKLKEKIWSIMVNEADSNLPAEQLFQKNLEKPVTFRDVYQTLPNKLNQSMKTDLSKPLAFVALLHLANEQNLKLTPQADLKNFRIEHNKGDLV